MKMYLILFLQLFSIAITLTNAKPFPKIVGGVESKPNEFPYLVSMSMDDFHFCGGAIITKRHIITAAHCIIQLTKRDLPYIQIRAGSLNYMSGGKVYYVEDIRYHILYKRNTQASPYDIALVKLESSLQYDCYIQPIELMRYIPNAAELTTSTGWGLIDSSMRTSPLEQRKLDMLIVPQGVCGQAWRQIVIDEKFICTSAGRHTGICDGDSGGPLIYKNKLLGIASWGSKTCAVGKPDVFTSVPYFFDWIKRNSQL